MVAFLHKYFSNIPAVFIDGTLYALIAWFTFNQSYLSGDESAKYVEPETKFWLNWMIGSCAVTLTAIKMFRSTAYADHKQDKADNK